MEFVFMDEAGYSFDWKQEKDMEQQPFYVCSAITIPSENLVNCYKYIQQEIQALALPGKKKVIGKKFEIKGKDIARGSGWWDKHNTERNKVRDLMLGAPAKFGGRAFIAIINKKAHLEKYVTPAEPDALCIQFLFERLEWYLSEKGAYAYLIYDQNKRLEEGIKDLTGSLIKDGSYIVNSDYHFSLAHIVEMAFGDSKNSIGLQIADFYASLTYSYYKDGKLADSNWWKLLYKSLHNKDGKIIGFGLKEFPHQTS